MIDRDTLAVALCDLECGRLPTEAPEARRHAQARMRNRQDLGDFESGRYCADCFEKAEELKGHYDRVAYRRGFEWGHA